MFGFYVVLACVCRVAPLLNAARLNDETEPVPNDSGALDVPAVPNDSGALDVPAVPNDSGALDVPAVPNDSGALDIPAVPNDSGALDVPEDGYNRTYCVVPHISNVEGYILRCFKHTLLAYGFSLTTLVSETTAKKPQKVETKNELATYAVDWKVQGHHLKASALNGTWFPFNAFCGKMFVRLTATAPNLDDFPPSKYVYIALGKNDDYSMDETQQTNIFQVWLSEYFNLHDYPENYKINSVTQSTLNGQNVHVVEFRDLAMKVSQKMVADKGYGNKPSAANFHRVGVVSESAWLLTEPELGCTPIRELGKEQIQMGYWHLSVHLAQGRQAWILFTCELKTPDCTNKHRAVVKVVGKGLNIVTYVKIPIPLTSSSSERWECTFWWLPHRWADETTSGTEKMCAVQTPQTTNSQNMCKKNYVWQIGKTDFYGQGYFHANPMSDPMLFL